MSNDNNNEKHRYYSNAIGFTAVCILFIFLSRGCSNILAEQEKTKQIQIMYQKK